jgi:hypothetical protein
MSQPGQGSARVALSQNEIESLCLKAARGAGLSWGLAEEAGFAAGWLAARGLDATALLLTLLNDRAGKDFGAPRPTPGHWQNAGPRPLCPVTLGAALTDSALLSDGPFSRDTRIDPVAMPLLLVPFLARAAQLRAKPVAVDWQSGRLDFTQDGAFDPMTAASWMGETALALTLRGTPQSLPASPVAKRGGLPAIPLDSVDGLSALALRTTVPATETSRRGAGSATPDTD